MKREYVNGPSHWDMYAVVKSAAEDGKFTDYSQPTFLHMSGKTLTVHKAYAWKGTQPQFDRLVCNTTNRKLKSTLKELVLVTVTTFDRQLNLTAEE